MRPSATSSAMRAWTRIRPYATISVRRAKCRPGVYPPPMRVRVLAPGLAVAGVLAASGCGSDGTATVTVTTAARGTTAAASTTAAGVPTTRSTVTEPPPTTTGPPATTTATVVRTTTRTTRAAPRPVAATTTVATTAPTPAAADPDPVGGTVPSSGRVRGNGYSVQVPTGWNDASSRFEGDEDAVDLNLAKRPGSGPTSLIFTDSSRPDRTDGRTVRELADGLRQDILEQFPTAKIVRGRDLRVDREPAVSFRVQRTAGDSVFRQRQVLVLRRGVLVVVRLTSPGADFREDTLVFRRFLASWRWD